jgi:hypothetical protein
VAGLLKAQASELQTGMAVVLDSGQTQQSGGSEYEIIRSVLSKDGSVAEFVGKGMEQTAA